MEIPGEVKPILEKIVDDTACSIEFWKEAKGEELTDMFFELSSELMLSDLDEDMLPIGYKLVGYIYYWETNCQFSGWYAIQNKADELDTIIECYKLVGLAAEADGIKKASEKWFETDGDHEAAGNAYSSISNEYSTDFDRWDYLSDYFVNNAKSLFYR